MTNRMRLFWLTTAALLGVLSLLALFLQPARAYATELAIIEWRAPVLLSSQIGSPAITPVINRAFRMDDAGEPMDGPILPGQIVSMGSIHALRDMAPVLESGAWVMFDLERWPHTSDWEQAHPRRSMRRFVEAGRARGFRVILAPSGYFRDRAIGLAADAFHAQVQHIHDASKYRATVCAIARAFDGPVIAQLTASGHSPLHHTVEELTRQYRAGLACTDRFAIWGGASPQTLAVAQEFMRRVVP